MQYPEVKTAKSIDLTQGVSELLNLISDHSSVKVIINKADISF